MTLRFAVYARKPLGHLLGDVLAALNRCPATAPAVVSLASRRGREDLSREEVLRSAARTSFDTCHLESSQSETTVIWRYGPGQAVPMIFGTVKLPSDQLSLFQDVLARLCALGAGSYAYCDLATAATTASDGTDPYLSRRVPFDLYWWNLFGPEYAGLLSVDEAIRLNVSRIESVMGGALIVVTRPSPALNVDLSKIGQVAKTWPLFLRWNPKAAISVNIDYSEIRNLPPPRVPGEPGIESIIGPANEFIASVPEKAQHFLDWAGSKGLRPESEDDFRQLFREYEAVIRDEYLVSAIAAYGEAVRKRLDGEWGKGILFGRGEPVVGRPGKPWSRRRIVHEALRALQGEDDG